VDTAQHRHQLSATLSHHAEGFGRHDFKFGVEIERGRNRGDFALNRGIYYLDYDGRPFRAYSYSYDVAGNTRRESDFAQDSWRATDRLTLNLGVRFDRHHGGSDSDTVWRTTGWSPRVGVAWDVSGDHRSVLRASFGRYYETLPIWYFFPALSGFGDGV